MKSPIPPYMWPSGITYLIIYLSLLFSCSVNENRYRVIVQLNSEHYQETVWKEPPQIAIWISDSLGNRCQTLFITNKTGLKSWIGQDSVPTSLPYWKMNCQVQLPSLKLEAISGATPVNSYESVFDAPEWAKWVYLEVNISGDYNSRFKMNVKDEIYHDFGNGQPALVYRIQLPDTGASALEYVGRSSQISSKFLPNDDTGITTARQLIEGVHIKKL